MNNDNEIIKCEVLESFYIENKGLVISFKHSVFDSLSRPTSKEKIYQLFPNGSEVKIHYSNNEIISSEILNIDISLACFGELKPTIHLLISGKNKIVQPKSIIYLNLRLR